MLGTDDGLSQYPPDQVHLVNGVGYVGKKKNRQDVYRRFKERGYTFDKVIHPTATITEGVQVMAGAIVQVGSTLGENCIINTKVSVDHDCMVGHNVHLAPGVTVCSNVRIWQGTFVGAGSILGNNINIGRNCFIGAGMVVGDPNDEAKLIR